MDPAVVNPAANRWRGVSSALSYSTLALSLAASLVAESLFGRQSAGWLVPLLSLFVLLGVVLVASRNPKVFRLAVVLLAVPIAAVTFRWLRPDSDLAVAIFFGSLIAFYLLAAGTILVDVLRKGRVSVQKVVGAVCVYLLLGVAWALAFAWMHRVDPGALAFPEGDPGLEGGWTLATYQYFSFVTLTTLGYGDILPRSDDARTLAMVEAVVGQLYVAVLLARLVSLEVTHSARPDEAD